MELGKIFVAAIVFVLGASFFSSVQSKCSAYSGSLDSLVHAFPYIYLLVITVFPILLLLVGEKK